MSQDRPARGATVTIRPAVDTDYDAIVELWRDSGIKASLRGRDRREEYLRQRRQFCDLYLVATADDTVVGVVFGTTDGRKGWVNRLAVRRQYQRRGVATRLVRRCQDAFAWRGIEIIAALVEPENRASRAFFEKLGYVTDVPVLYYRRRAHPDV